MSAYDATEGQKALAITILAENFGKELPPALANIWLDLLAPYPANQVKAAVRAVIERYEYKTLPPFAVLKHELDNLAGTSEQAVALQAEAEWVLLRENIARLGIYRQPDMHPTTAHVVRVMGGWEAVCHWETRSLDFKHKDFCELWTQAHGKADVLALGAAEVQKAIAQTRGGFVRVGAALPNGLLKALSETGKQGALVS
ncbi:MAG: hypothetical protein K2O70_01840 [Desulfovibrionaceae bacterium]|nr:hypothetical protein [Desulfovibrionaceae bacterium]